ncbi:MAG: arsenic resistance protein [Acidimicrobiia bacterium]|nr:arsenic resistance protein [Acidimicrobiia bacterium]
MLALTFAGIHSTAFTDAIRPRPRTAWVSLVINFVWVPLLAGALGWVFLSDDPDLRIGLVMLLVTPCTDWYLVFIATARGNVALGAALLPVNLILQFTLLPIFVVVLTGTAADVPIGDLLLSVAVVLGTPLAVAIGVRVCGGEGRGPRTSRRPPRPIRTGRLGLARDGRRCNLRRPRPARRRCAQIVAATPRSASRVLRRRLSDRQHRGDPAGPGPPRASHAHHDDDGP